MESFWLYDGRIELKFNKKKHTYYYNGYVVPNVTSIVGIIDKSGPMMGWALKEAASYVNSELCYRTADEAGAVVVYKGEINQICDGLKKIAKKKSKEAADIGTKAHAWIESHIAAQQNFEHSPPLPDDPLVRSCVEKFIEWEVNNHVEYIESERKVFSVQHQYTGTLDVIALLNGDRVIIDFKTSNALYPEYILQTAAYEWAYLEEFQDVAGGLDRVLLRIGKGDGTFEEKRLGSSLKDGSFSIFLSCLDVYNWLQKEAYKYASGHSEIL